MKKILHFKWNETLYQQYFEKMEKKKAYFSWAKFTVGYATSC